MLETSKSEISTEKGWIGVLKSEIEAAEGGMATKTVKKSVRIN